MKRLACTVVAWVAAGFLAKASLAQAVTADLSKYDAGCGVAVRQDGDLLHLSWPMAEGEFGRVVLDVRPGRPLVSALGTSETAQADVKAVLQNVEPVTYLTVGTRNAPIGRPPEMDPFNVFFDSPARRAYRTYLSQLRVREARVKSQGRRVTVSVGELRAGPFGGELEITVYAGGRLVHVEAVVSTEEDRRAILYDAGLLGDQAGWTRAAWVDTEGQYHNENVVLTALDMSLPVRYRTLVAETDAGSVACFPPPHQFFFPRDYTDNLQNVWIGRGHRGIANVFGFGIRQSETGGGNFVPWVNAPPRTRQRLGVFYLLSKANAENTLREVVKYTHADRFPELPGMLTFSSHWHMAVTITAMQAKARGIDQGIPEFVSMFKNMGVDMLHLAEFHGDGHPRDSGPLRLPEMDAMFAECKRLSDDDLLIMPGEEANVYFGLEYPGRHPGHWVYLFPKPVYWIMKREPGEEVVSKDPKYGTVYRVAGRHDLMELFRREHGLAWTSHPRIKASSWTPDIFRKEDFYLADFWLGAAWKAMPADLSRERLGDRALDVLSDMDNWGQKKYMLGEVDVFKLDHTHELYGHMNVNYVRLDELPKFEKGWQPLLDALRAGKFFVTTGEVLVREFRIGDKLSGESLTLKTGARPEVRAELEWTFPLRFLELVSGDGRKVYRERIDLPETEPFGHRTFKLKPDLTGRTWARLEAWDIAANGAFTQPVWLEAK